MCPRLTPGKAAHDTGPTEEPTETDETDNGETGSGEQKELEEPRSSGGSRLLKKKKKVSIFFFFIPTNLGEMEVTYPDAKRIKVVAGNNHSKSAVAE